MKLILEFVPVTESLPEIDVNAPEYMQKVHCLVRSETGKVRAGTYARSAYARTEKGRLPRWEEYPGGRLWFGQPITHWAPLPKELEE